MSVCLFALKYIANRWTNMTRYSVLKIIWRFIIQNQQKKAWMSLLDKKPSDFLRENKSNIILIKFKFLDKQLIDKVNVFFPKIYGN